MMDADQSRYERICVVFERRPDGGLRVSSPDVPGFRLSHRNASLVREDIVPALETIIGEIVGREAHVRMAGSVSIPVEPQEPTSVEYETKFAA